MINNPYYINARFLSQPLTGVQRFSIELLKALDDLIEPKQAIALCPAPLNIEPDYKNINVQPGHGMDGNLWEQICLPWQTRGVLLFSPANIGPYFKKKQIAAIHDVSVFAFPEAYTWTFRLKYRLIFKRLAKKAVHIITASEFSKAEIQRWLKMPADRISVVHEGCEHLERIDEDLSILSRLNIRKKPFFVVVGSHSLHKNLKVVLEANELLDSSKFNIVMVGADNPRVFQSISLPRANNLIKAEYIMDSELKALYKHASGLIFPSLYEGFGLPLVEAMASGCPVICSDIASSREVCDSAALYFDPFSAAELTEKLSMVLKKRVDIVGLRERGIRRAKIFSWKKTAQATLEVIDRFL